MAVMRYNEKIPSTTAMGSGTKNPSGDKKLQSRRPRPSGMVYATYRPVGPTCPESCALLSKKIRAKRHGALTEEDGGRAYREAIYQVHTDCDDIRGWSYTHDWKNEEVRAWRDTLPENVGIVASCDSIDQAREAVALGWLTVAIVLPSADGENFTREEVQRVRSEVGKELPGSVTPCPATYAFADIGCADCMACQFAPNRESVTVIVFPAHSHARRAAADPSADGGCYAQLGNVAIHEKRAADRVTDFHAWGTRLPKYSMIRWSVSGDLSNGRAAQAGNARLPVVA